MKQLGMTLLLGGEPLHRGAPRLRPGGGPRRPDGQRGPPRRPAGTGREQEHLRPLRRAPWPWHLRGHLGGPGLPHPEHARDPQRRGRGLEGAAASRCSAGRAVVSPTNTTGRTASGRGRSGRHDQHALGRRVEENSFGTHEFMDLVELLGSEAYIAGNVGSGTPQEMTEWVEYMTADANSPMANLRRQNGRDKPWKLAYFGVGNETWGCGGNMRPEYYADEYRRFNTFVKNYHRSKPHLPHRGRRERSTTSWTEVLMGEAGRQMNGLSLHYYTLPPVTGAQGPGDQLRRGRVVLDAQRTLRMDELITKHAEVMDKAEAEAEARALPRRQQEGRPRGRRVGHVVRRREGHGARLPLPAELASRRPRRGAELPHLPAPRRPRHHGQHRPDA